ncbi:MAG: AAA family ATPase [Treponemataceae bacterium]|nr:AAA family ATPase [Treponemataceae bacterium]
MKPLQLTMFNIGPFVGEHHIDFTRLEDIFLICGKTGAGKSTIFDALCFALYGELAGSRTGLYSRIKSDFAALTDDCWVRLDFFLGPARYRVERHPQQERPKTRGTGTTTVDETALLFLWDEGKGWQSLSGKTSETNRIIRELLGLSREEFSKIVLLPQGEFARFLRLNSTERQQVLQKLFPVEQAVRLREWASQRARDLASRQEEAQRLFQDILSRYDPEQGKERKDQLRQRVDHLAEKKGLLVELRKQLETYLSLVQRWETMEGQRKEVGAQKKALEVQRPAIQSQEHLLARIQESRALFPLWEQVQQARQDVAERTRTKAEREAALARSREELEQQEEERPRYEKLREELNQLREQRGLLEQAVKEEETLCQNRKLLQELQQKKSLLEARLGKLTEALQNETHRLEELEGLAAAFPEYQEKNSTLQDLLRLYRELLQRREKIDTWEEQEGLLRQQIEEKRRAIQEKEKTLAALDAELRQTEGALLRQRQEQAALYLAATLQPGSPCPVCGSTHHPHPARAEGELTDVAPLLEELRQRREQVQQVLKDVGASYGAAEREAALIREQREEALRYYPSIRENLMALEGSFPELKGLTSSDQFPSGEGIQRALAGASSLATEMAGLSQKANRARQERDALFGHYVQHQQEMGNVQAELARLEEQIKNTETLIREQEGRLVRFTEKWQTDSVATALRLLTQRLSEGDAALARYEQHLQDLKNQGAAIHSQCQAATEQLEEAERRAQELAERFSRALAESGIATVAELEELKRALEQEETLQEGINRFYQDQQALEGRLHQIELEQTRLQEELGALKKKMVPPAPNEGGTPVQAERAISLSAEPAEIMRFFTEAEMPLAEELQDRLTGLQQEETALTQQREDLLRELVTLEEDGRRYEEAKGRYESLREEYGRLRTLADDLSGNNPKRIAFDAWLLQLYLAEVATYANERLRKMSEGRYSLLLQGERSGGRGRAGLDLEVFDAYTGKARPCHTLSGGESFMASISLALGLADSIQNRSGAIRLDAIFIDEGFGSLDEASLELALAILDEIREHRMVGLISHVPEMKNRIPSRIEVVKSISGSSLRIVS